MEEHYDQEFDRLFARDLKASGQGAQPHPEEWSTLASRLDADGKRGRWPILLPWLLLAAMATGNGWMLVQWRALQEEVANWPQQPQKGTQSAPMLPEHHAAIIYDTVYRTVVITRRVVEERLSLQENYRSDHQSLPKDSLAAKQRNKPEWTVAKQNPGEQPSAKTKAVIPSSTSLHDIENQSVIVKENKNNAAPASDHSVVDALARATGDTTHRDPIPDLAAAKNVDSTSRQPSTKGRVDSLLTQSSATAPFIRRHRTPVRWRIGAGMGLASPLGDLDLHFSRSLAVSLCGEILLGQHWAIAPGMTYVRYDYQLREFDPRLLVNTPIPPSQEYQLRYIEGSMTHWTPSLALRYRFRPDQSWSWYIGAGYAARFTFPGSTEYEFNRLQTGEEYHYEIRPKVPDRVQMGLTHVGLEYAVYPRWTLFAEGSGLFDVGPGQRTFPMLIGQLGIKWRGK